MTSKSPAANDTLSVFIMETLLTASIDDGAISIYALDELGAGNE